MVLYALRAVGSYSFVVTEGLSVCTLEGPFVAKNKSAFESRRRVIAPYPLQCQSERNSDSNFHAANPSQRYPVIS